MANKKQSGMQKGEGSDSDSAFYESDNRDVVLKTASLELRSRQIKEFKVNPEKDEKNHVKQWRKWCRDAISELHKLKAYGGGSLANFAAQKLHMEREKQASKTAWEQSEEWADDDDDDNDGADLASFSGSAKESTTFRYKDLSEAVKELDRMLVPWVQQCLPTWAKDAVAMCDLNSAVKMMVYIDKEVNPDLYTRKVSTLMDLLECEYKGDYSKWKASVKNAYAAFCQVDITPRDLQ